MDKNLLLIFPNPSSGILNVQSNEKIESIEVFDLYGKSTVQFDSITNNAQIDLGRLASGNYILLAKFATGTVQRKISIH